MSEEQIRNSEDINISENISTQEIYADIKKQIIDIVESAISKELIKNDKITCVKSDYSYVNTLMCDEDVEKDIKYCVKHSTGGHFKGSLQYETDNINIKQKNSEQIKNNLQKNSDILCNAKIESKFIKKKTRRCKNSNNNFQQPIEEIETQNVHCDIKEKTENKFTSDKNVENSIYYVNYENKDFSENILIKDLNASTANPHWRQFLAAMGPYLMILSAGLSSGFSATLLPQLKREQSVILVNEQSPSWIASMAALPMAPGCFIGGWIMEKLGRRQALCILSIPFFIGWVLIASASNLPLMLAGRFLNGLSIGLLAPSMSVFISETSTPKLRGMFLAFLSFNLALGIFIAHLIGTWISWQWTAAICALFPLFSAALLALIPESPVWLFSKGRTDDAIKSFYWLRGCGEEGETELRALIDKYKNINTSSTESWTQKLKNLRNPTFSKPLLIVITIYLTCQFAGVHTITFYSVDILEMAVGKGVNSYMAMLLIDFLRVIATLITIFTCRRCPRRILCIISGCLTAFSLAGLSGFLYVYNDKIPQHLTIVPLCLLSAFIVAINIGLMPLPWIIVGEIFPARFRSFGAGLASAIGYLSTFIVVKTAPGMMVNLGQVVTFMFYSAVAMVGTIILIFIMPETKGKSLLDIEKMFENRKPKENLKSNV